MSDARPRDESSSVESPPSRDAATPEKKDVVLLGPPTPDGHGVFVLRARDERLEAGELRALEEGRPITGEVVSLAPRRENPRVCDVRDSVAPPAGTSGAKKGPAQVASSAYRENWDAVFGGPARDRALN